ncbi:MAG: methionine--tRNA ligase [Erythrobacter sp.]
MKSYLTTPIYYVNAAPHIGHAHTSVMADILKRNKQARGIETLMSTGCDEHGQKNQEAAEELGLAPQDYLDQRAAEFQRLFDLLGVDYDFYVRTTRSGHKEEVARAEQKLFDAGLIVKKSYTGKYCKGCEQFKKESDLNEDGRCPEHTTIELELIDEPNYFFPMEPYRQGLIDHINANPDFVDPPMYRGELLKMLEEPLEDLSISRPKPRVSLGVDLPFDDDHVTYVWFDALLNYLTNLEFPDGDYQQWWGKCRHLIGKDILKTHGVYWPTMLMALGLSLPKGLVVHGHWLGDGGVKMSKTLGNVVDPIEVTDKLGVDALRYYLARHMRTENDSQISVDAIGQTYSSELANKFGNLLSRAGKFAKARFDDAIPACGDLTAEDEAVRAQSLAAAKGLAEEITLTQLPERVQAIVDAADALNGYFADAAPWNLMKEEATVARAGTVVYVALDSLRLLFEALRQVIPVSSAKALAMLGVDAHAAPWEPALDQLQSGKALGEIDVLFARVD